MPVTLFCGGGGCDSGVDAGPEPLPACSALGVVGDVLGIGDCAGLFADCSDVSSAITASGVKSVIPVTGRASVISGCGGSVTGDGGGGLVDGAVVGDGCGVTYGGAVRVDLAGGGCCDGWHCPVGGSCLGHGSDATGRVVGDDVGVSCGGCDCDCVGVRGLLPRVGGGPSSLECMPAGERALHDVLG